MATPEDIKIRISAQNDSKKAFNEVNTDLKRTSTTASQTQKAVMGTTSGFSGMGRSAGQAGIQVQQLVGQIQAGTNPMLALSQQAADLGFVLGAPLVGAVAGIAASFAMVLLPSLFNTSQGVEELIKDIDDLNDTMDTLTAGQKVIKIRELNNAISEQSDIIDDTSRRLKILNTLHADEIRAVDIKKMEDLTAARDTARQRIIQLQEEIDILNGKRTEENAAIERMIKNLTDQAATLGMTSTELAIYQAKQEGATEADLKAIRAKRAIIDQYELEKQTSADLADGLAKIDEARDKYAEKHRKQQAEMAKNADAALKANLQSLKPLEDGLVNLINGTKSTKDAFADMARSIVNDLIRIQIQQSITQPLAGLLGSGGIGGLFGSLFGGGSSVTPGIGVGTAATPLAGISFAGGGYTGSGARSGGVDGQGGFPAILHPNETVVDHAQGQTGGVTINQTINVTTGVQQTVRTEIASLMPQIAAASKQAVLDARKRGGSFGAAFGA